LAFFVSFFLVGVFGAFLGVSFFAGALALADMFAGLRRQGEARLDAGAVCDWRARRVVRCACGRA